MPNNVQPDLPPPRPQRKRIRRLLLLIPLLFVVPVLLCAPGPDASRLWATALDALHVTQRERFSALALLALGLLGLLTAMRAWTSGGRR